MRRAAIEQQNQAILRRQREFRLTADVVVEAWMAFAEVQAVAVIGSVAKALWMEIPRFSDFRRAGIEVWHECGDLDLALWIDSQERLGALRRAAALSLRAAFERGAGTSVVRRDPFQQSGCRIQAVGRSVGAGKLRDAVRAGRRTAAFSDRSPFSAQGGLVVLSQTVAVIKAENQVIEEIQYLARGGPDES